MLISYLSRPNTSVQFVKGFKQVFISRKDFHSKNEKYIYNSYLLIKLFTSEEISNFLRLLSEILKYTEIDCQVVWNRTIKVLFIQYRS